MKFLLTVLFFIIGCSEKKLSKSLETTKRTEEVKCLDESEPLLKIKTKAGPLLIACGVNLESEFSVYSLIDNQTSNLITYSALDNIKTTQKEDTLVLTEKKYFKDLFRPFFEKSISCTSKACTIKEICVFKKDQGLEIDKSFFNSFQNKITKKEIPDEAEIFKIFDYAISKNPYSLEFFKTPPMLFDGATAEAYKESKNILIRMKKMNCL